MPIIDLLCGLNPVASAEFIISAVVAFSQTGSLAGKERMDKCCRSQELMEVKTWQDHAGQVNFFFQSRRRTLTSLKVAAVKNIRPAVQNGTMKTEESVIIPECIASHGKHGGH